MYTFIILFITDYALTYIGVASGNIIEANPFMKYFMTFNFLPGLALRTLLALAFCLVFFCIKLKNQRIYSKLIHFVIALFFIILTFHISWIYKVIVA